MNKTTVLRKLVALGLGTILLLTGCMGPLSNLGDLPLLGNIFAGDAAPKVTCDDVTLGRAAAMPTQRVILTAVPTHFDEYAAFKVTAPDATHSVIMPIERLPDGGGLFVVPLHPNHTQGGGPVTLQMIDGSDQTCEPLAFTIAAMPDAAGAFFDLIAVIEQYYAEADRLFDHGASDASPFALPLAMAGESILGPENANSLKNIATGQAPASASITATDWAVIDALVGVSGVVPALQAEVSALRQQDRLQLGDAPSARQATVASTAPNQVIPVKPASPALLGRSTSTGTKPLLLASQPSLVGELFCTGPWYEPSAATLSDMMIQQKVLAQAKDKSGPWVSAAGGLASVIAALSLIPTAGVPNPVTVGAGGVALGLGAVDTIMEAGQNLLPSEFVDLTFTVYDQTYFEDSPDLTGTWQEAKVTAGSKGMSLDGMILNQLLKFATGGTVKHFGQHGGDKLLVATGDYMTDTWSGMWATELTNRNQLADGTGLVNLPACTFGPTDISAEEYSIANFVPADGIGRTTGHGTFAVNDISFTELIVRPRADKFAGQEFTAGRRVEVKPIKVSIEPERVWVEPGVSSVIFTAKVEDAYNKNLDIEISHPPFRVVELAGGSDGLYTFSVAVSPEKSDYPATVQAVSTSTTGLRARADAPPRLAQAIIRMDGELSISPTAACLAPGETQSFTAEAQGSASGSVRWEASAGSIDSRGRFTAPKQAGPVTVRATSASDPSLTAEAQVTVGNCICQSTANLGLGGSHQGDVTSIWREGSDNAGRLSRILLVFGEGDTVTLTFGPTQMLPSGAGGALGGMLGDLFDGLNLEELDGAMDMGGMGLYGLGGFPADGGHGPLPSETGTYTAVFEGNITSNMTFTVAAASPGHQEIGAPPHVNVVIEEFVQGKKPHEAMIRGYVEGHVLVTMLNGEYTVSDEERPPLLTPVKIYFQGDYDTIAPGFGNQINCSGRPLR